ncbi:hypothetical protein NE237_020093 [Protea cynaroides]|uniref:Uncharacterized protein n=1 Tax=Protea cynaroides TaxID=273540 RepID=A0A9Q0K3J8_9MAGN|nr:hypothetical protein NE237_020093 [Protea cynaroides]
MATITAVDFCGVLSESKKIVNAHSRHFLALSVLFLLPLTFCLVFFPTLRQAIIEPKRNPAESLLRYSPEQRFFFETIGLSIIYALTIVTLSLCAAGTVTYSVYHGFFGRPVKFASAIKSLLNSFLRLFVTFVCSEVILLAISVVVGGIMFLVIKVMELLGFQISLSSPYFIAVCAIGLVVLGFGLVYLQVNWALASVVVVVESSWGLEPLRRSAYLVKGVRGVVASLLLFFGLIFGITVWVNWGLAVVPGGLKDWIFVALNVIASALIILCILHSVATNTVLYMYCKALRGELAGEIAEEFTGEYFSLPFDEEKLPHMRTIPSFSFPTQYVLRPNATEKEQINMDKIKEEKVQRFEEFVDRRLKPDLVRAIGERDKVFEQQKVFLDLRRSIENLERNGVTSLRTMVNLGSEVYMQADVPDTRHIFVDIGLGFHVEFTWSEALEFISKKEERLARQIEEYTHLIASIKAQIKLVCEAVELQPSSSYSDEGCTLLYFLKKLSRRYHYSCFRRRYSWLRDSLSGFYNFSSSDSSTFRDQDDDSCNTEL